MKILRGAGADKSWVERWKILGTGAGLGAPDGRAKNLGRNRLLKCKTEV